jgi:glycosyltransferase involved in cell wall biosynthesis
MKIKDIAMISKRYNLAIIQTHATQFDGPLFKRLSQYSDIDITVYYTKPTGKAPPDKELGRSPDWDNEVACGYRYKTKDKGFLGTWRFLEHIANGNHNLVIIGGSARFYSCLFALYVRLRGIAAGLRSDMILSYVQPRNIKSILKRFLLPCMFKLYSSGHPTGTLAEQYLLRYGFPENRIFRFPYAVDNNYLSGRCSRYQLQRDRIRRALGIGTDCFVVLGVVKFAEREDPMTLLLGFSKLLECCPTAHLVLVGDGPMMKDIKAAINERRISNVHLPGFVRYSRLPLFYSIADVFVHPPVQESWGVSVNEAMACGLPVVVANTVGSYVDLVKPGETGFVFEARNPEDLANCLNRLGCNRNLREEMGSNARELIKDWGFDCVEKSLLKALATITKKKNNEKRENL